MTAWRAPASSGFLDGTCDCRTEEREGDPEGQSLAEPIRDFFNIQNFSDASKSARRESPAGEKRGKNLLIHTCDRKAEDFTVDPHDDARAVAVIAEVPFAPIDARGHRRWNGFS